MVNDILQLLKYQEKQLRTVLKDGKPWFVVEDVCNILEIWKHQDVVGRLGEDEKRFIIVDTLGGKQEMAVINEYGLYSLIVLSRKLEARQFKRWITHEALPSIKRIGICSSNAEDFFINQGGDSNAYQA